jgi:twitching motility two-component system response regulator PilH
VAFFDLFKRKAPAKPAAKPFVMPPGLVPNQPQAPVPAPAAREPAAPVPDVIPAEVVTEAEVAAATPAEPAQPSHEGPERRERNRRHARPGTRVLVIDDSPTIVALLKRMLQQNQLDVLEAFDAESGIEIARREVPDLIFLDIVLPGMDGFNALRTLRRDPITKHLPIIMISGNAQATEQFYVQRIGADDFMKKPFSRAEVFMRIEALLDAENIPRHGAKPGTRAEAAAAAGEG